MTERGPRKDEAPAEATPATFEAALKRLHEIVQALERGDLPLEESLALFEEGVRLSRESQAKLDAAEKRVEQLLDVDDRGRTRTQPFETEAAEEQEGPLDEEEPPF